MFSRKKDTSGNYRDFDNEVNIIQDNSIPAPSPCVDYSFRHVEGRSFLLSYYNSSQNIQNRYVIYEIILSSDNTVSVSDTGTFDSNNQNPINNNEYSIECEGFSLDIIVCAYSKQQSSVKKSYVRIVNKSKNYVIDECLDEVNVEKPVEHRLVKIKKSRRFLVCFSRNLMEEQIFCKFISLVNDGVKFLGAKPMDVFFSESGLERFSLHYYENTVVLTVLTIAKVQGKNIRNLYHL